MLLEGIFPAITTPFYPDGRVYLRKLEHNVDRYSRAPISGMVVLGSTGEAVNLSDAEQREVLKIAFDHAYAEKVMIAGVGQESTKLTLELAEFAALLGYDVALVRTPSYYRPLLQADIKAQLAHFRFIADSSPLPILLYSVPPFTAYDLPLEAVSELATHPNIIGIKESGSDVDKIAAIRKATSQIKRSVNVTEVFSAVTGRMLRSLEGNTSVSGMVSASALASAGSAKSSTTAAVAPAPPPKKFKLRTKQVSFTVLAGAAHRLLPSLDAGADGGVLAFAAAAPQACYEVYAAWKEGDQTLAELKQMRISAAARRVGAEMGVPGLKYALDLNGYYGGMARMPLLPLTGEQKTEIDQLMADLKN